MRTGLHQRVTDPYHYDNLASLEYHKLFSHGQSWPTPGTINAPFGNRAATVLQLQTMGVRQVDLWHMGRQQVLL